MKRHAITLAVAMLLVFVALSPVEAHATLVRSAPTAGALLERSPTAVVLEFSEDLDPAFSAVQFRNGKNQIVEPGPGVIDPATPRVLRLTLPDLPKDSYTAIWKSRSAADGHITNGSVPFGVGVAATTTSLIPPLGAPDPATLPPPLPDTLARWLNLLMATVAFGGLPFGLLVWRPAWRAARRTGADCTTADAVMTRVLRRLILIGSGLFLVSNAVFLVTQAAAAADVPLVQAIGSPIIQLLSGRSGLLWLARVALTIQIVVLTWRLPLVGQGATRLWWIMLGIGSVVLLTLSLSAHAAADPQAAVAIPLDWLHIAAMVAWIGGLIPLTIAIQKARHDPERSLSIAQLIPRFSRLAMTCIVILTLSGIFSYMVHINGLNLLAATTYGRALLVKLGLFGLLLLLGGLNQFVFAPRLRASDHRMARWLAQSVRVEIVSGVLLLLAVGVMTSVAPSNIAWEEHERLGIAQEASEGPVHLVLRIGPAQIGDNEFAVDVTDPRPGAQGAPTKVLLRFDMVGMNMGKVQTETHATSMERYSARGSFAPMGGRWHVEVVLRRAGFDDVDHTFQVDILRAPADAL
ncbi:MAG: CopD family protein [Chloroflexota bacterium]|nr:CopD family protein [Chloroflexota bacterium]